jgi:hypothetical protein
LSDWLLHVPRDIQARAYRSGGEFGWSRQDAVWIAENLRGAHFLVIGVDVWLPTHPGPRIPTPFVYDWELRAELRSSDYPVAAAEFIRNFKWADTDASHQGLVPYFNLTVVRVDT